MEPSKERYDVLRERVEQEWRRILGAPRVEPGEIREWRRRLGVSQRRLSAYAGVSRDTISRIENGFREFHPKTLQYISAGFQLLERQSEPDKP